MKKIYLFSALFCFEYALFGMNNDYTPDVQRIIYEVGEIRQTTSIQSDTIVNLSSVVQSQGTSIGLLSDQLEKQAKEIENLKLIIAGLHKQIIVLRHEHSS